MTSSYNHRSGSLHVSIKGRLMPGVPWQKHYHAFCRFLGHARRTFLLPARDADRLPRVSRCPVVYGDVAL